MAREVIKILGQVKPGMATETDLYQVPSGRRAVISKIHAFNAASGAAIIKIAITPDNSATSAENYLIDSLGLAGRAGAEWDKITMQEFNEIRVESDTGNVIFHAYGVEVLPEKS